MQQLQEITCDHDGVALKGKLAMPEGRGPFPAVLVMHSALGLRHMVGDVAQRLAGLGYLAVATDMYGADANIGDEMKAGALYQALLDAPERLRDRCALWFDTVAARADVDAGRIAAIGYCFGGKCVLELARSGRDAMAVVSYHGILPTHAPARPGDIRGEVAAYCGAHDPYAPHEDIEALRQELITARAHYQITIFGEAAHGFTDPRADEIPHPGIAYNAIANKTSWAGTLALLEDVLS